MSAKFIKLTIASVDISEGTAEAYYPVFFNVRHIVSLGRATDDPCTAVCFVNDPYPPPAGWRPTFVMETPEQILALIERGEAA